MLQDNEDLPQIEKLARHEFDLDTEEQRRLQAQCELEVTKVCLSHIYLKEYLHNGVNY